MATALLVIDMQHGFFREPSSRARLDTHLDAMNRLIAGFRFAGQPVVFVRTVHDPEGSTWTLKMRAEGKGVMLDGSDDIKDVEGLLVPDDALSVQKTRHSAFIRTDLEPLLRGRGVANLALCGIFLEACVGATAGDGVEHDFPVVISREATLSRDPKQAKPMLAFLKREYAVEVRGVAEIIAGLPAAGGPPRQAGDADDVGGVAARVAASAP